MFSRKTPQTAQRGPAWKTSQKRHKRNMAADTIKQVSKNLAAHAQEYLISTAIMIPVFLVAVESFERTVKNTAETNTTSAPQKELRLADAAPDADAARKNLAHYVVAPQTLRIK